MSSARELQTACSNIWSICPSIKSRLAPVVWGAECLRYGEHRNGSVPVTYIKRLQNLSYNLSDEYRWVYIYIGHVEGILFYIRTTLDCISDRKDERHR